VAVRLAVAGVCAAVALAILWALNRRGTALGPLAALIGFAEPAEQGADGVAPERAPKKESV
jgi:hypothetical protein